ncbi:TlpA family protein disulfide reductase [Tepidibacter hydrothermalis]|uniref:TlpA disulfide reductase family protein n=1 Tax=Tepidibacter hydrothermalis TaxID=3036126 RepID=A0ABY8EBG3_9FIRM|nr:TlpA disulfide reductase family protein [Tepidibacter hydrothermalis]WFD10239.1 TlpA disulfide reductase family protein [Tepidibacter hydrothermalis]
MKKIYLAIFMIIALCASIVGCGKTEDNSEEKQTQLEQKDKSLKGKKMKFEEMGLEYYEPQIWAEKEGVSPACVIPGKYGVAYIVGEIPYEFLSTEFVKEIMKDSENAKTEEDQKEVLKKYQEKSKIFVNLMVLDKNKEKNGPNEDIERKQKVFSEYKYKEKVAEIDNLECYILYNDEYDESNLSDEEKKEFKEVRENIEEFKNSIRLFTPIDIDKKIAENKTVEFETKTIDGKKINSNIFKDNKLTMVNVWATFCGPCIGEMPDIQKLYDEIKKENINVVGIISDTPDDENEVLAKQILDKKGVKFVNIIPDEKLNKGILKDISGVPTTIFVDSEGNIVGQPIIGSRSKEEYKKEINKRLGSLK